MAVKHPTGATGGTELWLEAIFFKLEEIRTILEAGGGIPAPASKPVVVNMAQPEQPPIPAKAARKKRF